MLSQGPTDTYQSRKYLCHSPKPWQPGWGSNDISGFRVKLARISMNPGKVSRLHGL